MLESFLEPIQPDEDDNGVDKNDIGDVAQHVYDHLLELLGASPLASMNE